MSLYSSSSHRSVDKGRGSSSPDTAVAQTARRGSSRRVMIRRSWVRALGTSTDPKIAESDLRTVRVSRSPDRRAA
jgi:hypothetical protein